MLPYNEKLLFAILNCVRCSKEVFSILLQQTTHNKTSNFLAHKKKGVYYAQIHYSLAYHKRSTNRHRRFARFVFRVFRSGNKNHICPTYNHTVGRTVRPILWRRNRCADRHYLFADKTTARRIFSRFYNNHGFIRNISRCVFIFRQENF